MRHIRKMLLLVTGILLFIGLLIPVNKVKAAGIVASGSCGSSVTWTLDSSGTLTISGSGAMDDYTSENVPWKNYRSSIKSVVIEYGLSRVGNQAFSYCSQVKSVSFPITLTKIGRFAFSDCT